MWMFSSMIFFCKNITNSSILIGSLSLRFSYFLWNRQPIWSFHLNKVYFIFMGWMTGFLLYLDCGDIYGTNIVNTYLKSQLNWYFFSMFCILTIIFCLIFCILTIWEMTKLFEAKFCVHFVLFYNCINIVSMWTNHLLLTNIACI